MSRRRWVQHAVKKPGSLSRQLGIPERENIPTTLLKRIRRAPMGKLLKNPTAAGRSRIKITPLLKTRANLALTFRGFHRPGRR